MYLIVFCIAFFHIFILSIWTLFKKVDGVLSYTNDLKEYTQCYYPDSKNLR